MLSFKKCLNYDLQNNISRRTYNICHVRNKIEQSNIIKNQKFRIAFWNVVVLSVFYAFLFKTWWYKKAITEKGICQLPSSLPHNSGKYRIVKSATEVNVSKRPNSKIKYVRWWHLQCCFKNRFYKKLNVKLHYIRQVSPECGHCVSHGILARSEYFCYS